MGFVGGAGFISRAGFDIKSCLGPLGGGGEGDHSIGEESVVEEIYIGDRKNELGK